MGTPKFSDSTIADLAEAVADRIPPPPSRGQHTEAVGRAEFDALSERVDKLQDGHSELGRLEERIDGVKASTSANERRMAEALAQVARAVRDVDRRSVEGIKELSRATSESVGTLKASASKAHQRMDRYRDRFIGGTLVAGAVWAGAVWVVEHWTMLTGLR